MIVRVTNVRVCVYVLVWVWVWVYVGVVVGVGMGMGVGVGVGVCVCVWVCECADVCSGKYGRFGGVTCELLKNISFLMSASWAKKNSHTL